MPKRKHQQDTAAGQMATTLDEQQELLMNHTNNHSHNHSHNHSSNMREEERTRARQPSSSPPPIKLARGAPLSFSIESIMQPHHRLHQQLSQQLRAPSSPGLAGRGYGAQFGSRSPTPSSSGSGSGSGSRSPMSPGGRLLERSRSSSPATSSAGSESMPRRHSRRSPAPSTISRSSTPISPGGAGGDGDGQQSERLEAKCGAFLNGRASLFHAAKPGASPSHQFHQQHHPNERQQRASTSNSTPTPRPTSTFTHLNLSQGSRRQRSPAPSSSQQQQQQQQHQRHHNNHHHQPQQPQQQQHLSSSGNGGGGRLNQVECVLDNKEMWDKFYALNTEMIITKTGRRMFPVLKVQFYNLDPNARYAVSMDILPVDNKRYRYAYHKSCWQVAGKADPSAEPRLYPHPDSPFSGDLLARQVISFEKVKLTNNEMDKSGHIILNSMHKYQPRVHLVELKSTPLVPGAEGSPAGSKLAAQAAGPAGSANRYQQQQQQQQQAYQKPAAQQLDIEDYRTYVFPETVFIAVTAYQNQLITKMKIDKNPFAKGFRDSSRLSDLDRNDPFDYMGSLGPAAACAAAAAAAAAAQRNFAGSGPPGSQTGAGAQPALQLMQLEGHSSAEQAAYVQLLAAAQNPWYAAAAAAAASNPFNAASAGHLTPAALLPLPPPPPPVMSNPTPTSSAGGGPCATASLNSAQQQQQQLQATQMWLAAFSACLNQQQPPPLSGGANQNASPQAASPLGPLGGMLTAGLSPNAAAAAASRGQEEA